MRALVVEDDERIAAQLAEALTAAGFAVDTSHDGEAAEFLGMTETYDVVVLDLGLPKMDGISVLTSWRRGKRLMPVLILTARDDWSEKVRGFRAGADDYVVKPFRMEEVVVRCRSLVRRAAGHATSELTCGPLVLDTQLAIITLDGLPLKLTAFEWRVLSALMLRREVVIERADLIERVYEGDADVDSNSIEVIIGRLRRKIGAQMIETVRGRGYRLTADGA